MNLLFLKYNNYYNRIVKKEETLDNYHDACEVWTDEEGEDHYCYRTFTNINFHENDFLTTTQVVNWSDE